MNTSASWMPASVSASTSMPWPTVKRPPASSHVRSRPTSRRSCESGSSSRTETVWPAASAVRATEEPTRPAPTMRMNIPANITQRTDDQTSHLDQALRGPGAAPLSAAGGAPARRRRGAARLIGAVVLRRRRIGLGVLRGDRHVAGGRRREDDLTGRLGDDVLGGVADEVVHRAATTAEQRAAPDPRGLLGGQDD